MNKHLLNRREFSARCAAFGLSIPAAMLAQIGAMHGCSAAAVALAWAIRSGDVIAIPESGSPAHVKENAVALSTVLTARDLETLDAAYPGPAGAG